MLIRILFCLTVLLWGVCSQGQTSSSPRYDIVSSPICWKTAGKDSNLIRYTLVSPSSGQPKKLFYVNALGATVNPLGGILKHGWCCDCGSAGPDLNGIYSGSGTVPDFTFANLAGQFAIQSSGGGYNYVNYMDRFSTQIDYYAPGGYRTRTYHAGNVWDVYNSSNLERNGINIQSESGSTIYSYGKRTDGQFGPAFENGSFLQLSQQTIKLYSGRMNASYRGFYNDTISAGIKCDPQQPLDYSYLFPNFFDPSGKFSMTWDNARQGKMVREEEGIITDVTDANGDIEVFLSYNMPNANYRVLLTPEASTRYAVSYHSKDIGSFKINCAAGAGVTVSISWNAKEL